MTRHIKLPVVSQVRDHRVARSYSQEHHLMMICQWRSAPGVTDSTLSVSFDRHSGHDPRPAAPSAVMHAVTYP
jgi:hypothetical protein